MAKRSLLTRRDFIKAAGVGAVAMGVAPTIFLLEAGSWRLEGG